MNSLWRLRVYLKTQIGTLLVAYVCMLVLALTAAFYAFLAGPALNFVFTGDINQILHKSNGDVRFIFQLIPSAWLEQAQHVNTASALLIVPVLIMITALFKGVAQTGQFYLLGKISQNILQQLRHDTFASILKQPPSFFTRRTHGDLVTRITQDTLNIEQAIFYGCAPIVRDTLSILGLVAFCFVTDATLSLFIFVVVPLALIPLSRFTKWLKRVSRRGQDAQGAINAVTYETLAGIRVVQSFAAENFELKRLYQASVAYKKQALVSYFIRAVRSPTMETLGAVALGGILAFLGYQVQQHHADGSRYISFFAALVMMYEPIKKLGRVSDYLAAGHASADRIFELLDHEPVVRNKPNALQLSTFQHRIYFRNVHFAYEQKPVLRGIDLSIERGQVVALVGSSGAGKTSMIQLLPRFYDITEGSLTIDEHELRDLELHSLRDMMSMVGQDTFLFNTTVAANIAYGQPDTPLEKIMEAAKAAFAHEFIEKLPEQYQTVIGERGLTLSGGQRQRLAIARALLRNKPILILDEATSSLDVESERFVQSALERLMQDRTTIVIAHRLSTVQHAHKIAVLKEGLIVEEGTHQQLLAQQGEYARLYALQFAERPSHEA